MDAAACDRMIRGGAWAGFLLAVVLFVPLFNGSAGGRPGGGLYSLFRFVCLIWGIATLVLSWMVLQKQSRIAALLLCVSIPFSLLVAILLGSYVLLLIGVVLAGALLGGVIGCFIWQARFVEHTPPPAPPPADSRPISEEAQRMIKGSILDGNIPFFEEDGDPTPDEKTKWGWGIAAPVGLLIWAGYALVTKHVVMYDEYYRPPVEIKGLAVYAAALTLISAALFLHFHYFWGQTETLYEYYRKPKYAALAVLIISAFAFFILAMEGS